jgi:hypothetical protein
MDADPVADAYADAVRRISARLADYRERPMVVNLETGQCGACDQPVQARCGLFAYCSKDGSEGVCLHHYCACYVRACSDGQRAPDPHFPTNRWYPPEPGDADIEAFLSSSARIRAELLAAGKASLS